MSRNKILIFLIAILFFVIGKLPAVHGATPTGGQKTTADLQAQLGSGSSSTSGSAPASLTSSKDLTLGSKGAAVMDLQKYLNANGAQVAASGAGSPGNETSTFGPATKAALAKWQAAHGVSPAAGYFGAKTRKALLAVAPSGATGTVGKASTSTLISNTITASSSIATTSAVVLPPALPNPFLSSLKINIISLNSTLSTYGDKIILEFNLSSNEKTEINRIRFKNNGTFNNNYLINFRLVNSSTGLTIATVDAPVNGAVEFKMAADSKKMDKGLLVSGNAYQVWAYLLTPNYGSEKPKIRLDIESVADVSVFDFNDLNRVADISSANSFPIVGSTLTAF